MLPTNEAATLVLRVDERELRVLAGGEMVGPSFAGPWMIWVIFASGRNMGVAGVMAGEGRFEDGEKEGESCCGVHSGGGTDKRRGLRQPLRRRRTMLAHMNLDIFSNYLG